MSVASLGRTTLTRTGGRTCDHCGLPAHEHDKERVYPDKGPAGSYHYEYVCPE